MGDCAREEEHERKDARGAAEEREEQRDDEREDDRVREAAMAEAVFVGDADGEGDDVEIRKDRRDCA